LRETAAQIIKSGGSVKEASKKTGLGMTSVYNACRERGVTTDKLKNREDIKREAREKREAAANLVRQGESVSSAAQLLEISIGTVQRALVEFGVLDPNGHQARKIVEKEIVNKIRSEAAHEDNCKDFDISYDKLVDIAKKYRVAQSYRKLGIQRKFEILHALMTTTLTLRDLAKNFDTHEVNVTHIYRQARKAKIPVPTRKVGGGGGVDLLEFKSSNN
jgi:transposase